MLLALSPRLAWELIVVDNGSSDETPQVLQSIASPRLRAVREPRRGKSRALNRGLSLAKGELVVFSDDDVDPAPGWLEALAGAAAKHPEADVFGGKIAVDRSKVPAWIVRSRNLQEILTTEHDFGEVEQRYPANRFPQGPNLAVRRRALETVSQPWAEDLGPGTAIPVGDEKCFFCRLGQGGGRPRVYVPSAVVRHHPPAANFRLGRALRRCYWGGYSGALVNARHPEALEPGPRVSVAAALAGTRSVRELLCAAIRAFGYWRGRKG